MSIADVRVEYSKILEALDLKEIPGIDSETAEPVSLIGVRVDDCNCEPDCDVCGGAPLEPEHQVDSSLLADFIEAVKTGDMMTAKALVGRVFEDRGDAAIAGGLL